MNEMLAAPGEAVDLGLRWKPIRQARERDFSQLDELLAVLQSPFDEHPARDAVFADFPPDWASSIEISCSS